MRKAIRDHLRDFIAIAGLLTVAALATSYVIVQNQRLRIPLLEEKPFELKADFVDRAGGGPRPGPDGRRRRRAGRRRPPSTTRTAHAVVTFGIDRKFLPIYKNATILLRPKTGLKDMFFELDPGTRPRSDGEFQRATRSRSPTRRRTSTSTRSSSALDGDTRAYLRLLLVGAGQGLEGPRQGPRQAPRQPRPDQPRTSPRLNTEVAKRKENLATLVHNMNLLWGRVGRHRPARSSSSSRLRPGPGAIAQPVAPERAACGCPARPAPGTTRSRSPRRTSSRTVLGPTVNSLRPFARKLEAGQRLAGQPRQEHIRPGQAGDPPVRAQCAPAGRATCGPPPQNLVRATPRLTTVGSKLNELFNMAAYNPNGAESPGTPGRDEGYLYWLGWLGARRQQHVQLAGRARRLPPRLPDGDLQHGQVDPQRRARSRPVVTGLGPAPGRSVPAMTRMSGESDLDAEAGTLDRAHPGGGRLHAVLLRPAALPLGDLRRPESRSSRRATGSPPTSRRRSRCRRRPTSGSAASRSARSRSIGLAPESECHANPTVCNTTQATIEIEPQYAPISSDAKAILRSEDPARRDLRRAHAR